MKRIYHQWSAWECYPAGFYENKPPKGMTADQATEAYGAFLRDSSAFESALARVIVEWKHSCEHYLSNANMNRIAWLGQASACIALGLPSQFRAGFHRLSEQQQADANALALRYLNKWLEAQGEPALDADGAKCATEVELY